MSKSKTLVNIPSSDHTSAGEVRLSGTVGGFRLRCTVSGCRFRAVARWHADAQKRGFEHAGQHQFGPDYRVGGQE